MKVTFNEEQIKQLENWANELPTKYGVTFLQFLSKAVNEQNSTDQVQESTNQVENSIVS